MAKQNVLPHPPAFPATFQSYSNTAHKMHKAALNAVTADAGIAVVGAILAHVKGINTYARRVRKYGEELTAALVAIAPDAKAEQATEAATFKTYANLSNAKRAVKAAGFEPSAFNFSKTKDGIKPVKVEA